MLCPGKLIICLVWRRIHTPTFVHDSWWPDPAWLDCLPQVLAGCRGDDKTPGSHCIPLRNRSRITVRGRLVNKKQTLNAGLPLYKNSDLPHEGHIYYTTSTCLLHLNYQSMGCCITPDLAFIDVNCTAVAFMCGNAIISSLQTYLIWSLHCT